MLYLAYGSNLHPARLSARASSARFVATGFCASRRLAFHKAGDDGTAKCDAPSAENGATRLYGALYELNPSDNHRLDRIEGLGGGYQKAVLSVVTPSGPRDAFAYLAQSHFIASHLKPFHWYKQLVLEGAKYCHFPESYLAAISAVESIPDPQPDRAAANLGVLESGMVS
jgi:gamma-glutamylcyclotransferase (GGCT)/AIG2-like uncharacterized protein YtfP